MTSSSAAALLSHIFHLLITSIAATYLSEECPSLGGVYVDRSCVTRITNDYGHLYEQLRAECAESANATGHLLWPHRIENEKMLQIVSQLSQGECLLAGVRRGTANPSNPGLGWTYDSGSSLMGKITDQTLPQSLLPWADGHPHATATDCVSLVDGRMTDVECNAVSSCNALCQYEEPSAPSNQHYQQMDGTFRWDIQLSDQKYNIESVFDCAAQCSLHRICENFSWSQSLTECHLGYDNPVGHPSRVQHNHDFELFYKTYDHI